LILYGLMRCQGSIPFGFAKFSLSFICTKQAAHDHY
jgi:hypothetical protein